MAVYCRYAFKEPMMKRMAGLGMLIAIGSVTAAEAQSPRTFQATQIRDNCLRTFSNGDFCNTVLGMVQSRYGNTVTMMQWNAQVGVYNHKKRQGKLGKV
jgi:hypothetical protein